MNGLWFLWTLSPMFTEWSHRKWLIQQEWLVQRESILFPSCIESFCTVLPAPPLIVTFPQAFDLTTVWHCVGWWNAWWFESDCSIQTIGVCFIWLQLVCLIINKHAPVLTLKVLLGICQPFILLLVFNMGSLVWCTGWVVNVLYTCSQVISGHVRHFLQWGFCLKYTNLLFCC